MVVAGLGHRTGLAVTAGVTVGGGVAATITGTATAATTATTPTATRIRLRTSCSFSVAAWDGTVVSRTPSAPQLDLGRSTAGQERSFQIPTATPAASMAAAPHSTVPGSAGPAAPNSTS